MSSIDIKTLTSEPSPQVRGMLASKIATDYRNGEISGEAETIANDIFRILLKDVEVQIRKSLAEQLAYCGKVPRDIILKLANDAPEVASDVLEHTMVLTDDDLIQIVRSTAEVIKLCAIARRENVSEPLTSSLMETGQPSVIRTIVENKGAMLTERHINAAWQMLINSPSLLEKLVLRGGLAPTIAEKLYFAVSTELREQLSRQYSLNTPFFHKAVDDVREWELLGLTPSETGAQVSIEEKVEELVDALFLKKRLTHSFVMRALCLGNLNVFEAGIAKLAGVPRVNARILLLDRSGLGMQAIYKTAGMPEGFFKAVDVLLHLCLEETQFGRVKSQDFRKRIIERIHVEKYHQTIENMGYLLSIIGGKIVTPTDD